MVRDDAQPVVPPRVAVCLPGHEALLGCVRQELGNIPLLLDHLALVVPLIRAPVPVGAAGLFQ